MKAPGLPAISGQEKDELGILWAENGLNWPVRYRLRVSRMQNCDG